MAGLVGVLAFVPQAVLLVVSSFRYLPFVYIFLLRNSLSSGHPQKMFVFGVASLEAHYKDSVPFTASPPFILL